MKRKKWTEEEEQTLISAYSDLLSSRGGISQLQTREKKFQPIADRVNSLHHFLDPAAFPFRWTWRDVSIKIQNMRHQYLGVKLKLSEADPDLDHALHLWPNFILYKSVFGDIDPLPSPSSSSSSEVESLGKMVAELGEVLVGREERRRRKTEETVGDEEARRRCWRRREEMREEEEMEWMEKMMGMQMEHEKQVMQMQAEACQAQMQMLSILVRFVCPAASSGAGGIDGLQHHVMHNLQEEQQSPGGLVGDDVKNDVPSGEDYL